MTRQRIAKNCRIRISFSSIAIGNRTNMINRSSTYRLWDKNILCRSEDNESGQRQGVDCNAVISLSRAVQLRIRISYPRNVMALLRISRYENSNKDKERVLS